MSVETDVVQAAIGAILRQAQHDIDKIIAVLTDSADGGFEYRKGFNAGVEAGRYTERGDPFTHDIAGNKLPSIT